MSEPLNVKPEDPGPTPTSNASSNDGNRVEEQETITNTQILGESPLTIHIRRTHLTWCDPERVHDLFPDFMRPIAMNINYETPCDESDLEEGYTQNAVHFISGSPYEVNPEILLTFPMKSSDDDQSLLRRVWNELKDMDPHTANSGTSKYAPEQAKFKTVTSALVDEFNTVWHEHQECNQAIAEAERSFAASTESYRHAARESHDLYGKVEELQMELSFHYDCNVT